jgi:hypothetical protein
MPLVVFLPVIGAPLLTQLAAHLQMRLQMQMHTQLDAVAGMLYTGVELFPVDDMLQHKLSFALHKHGHKRSLGDCGHVTALLCMPEAALLAAYLPAANNNNADDSNAAHMHAHAHVALMHTTAVLCMLEDTLLTGASCTDNNNMLPLHLELQALGGLHADTHHTQMRTVCASASLAHVTVFPSPWAPVSCLGLCLSFTNLAQVHCGTSRHTACCIHVIATKDIPYSSYALLTIVLKTVC